MIDKFHVRFVFSLHVSSCDQSAWHWYELILWTNFLHTTWNMWASNWQTWLRLNLAFRWGHKSESRSWFINALSNLAASIGFWSSPCMLIAYYGPFICDFHLWFPMVNMYVWLWLVLGSSFQLPGSLRQRAGHGIGRWWDGAPQLTIGKWRKKENCALGKLVCQKLICIFNAL